MKPAVENSKIPILIVEDNEGKTMALKAALDGLDVEIHATASGEAALAASERNTFAAILLEVQMGRHFAADNGEQKDAHQEAQIPVMGGFETARRLRQCPGTADTPLLFLSASSPSEVDLSEGYPLGSVDYVFFPIIPQLLKAKVGVFMDLHRKTKQIARMAKDSETRNGELFRKLVEDVRDYAIYMIDPDGIVISWNKGAERIEGYQAWEILGRNYACFYTREDLGEGKPAFERSQAAEKGRYENIGWRVRKDGHWFWADEILTPIRNEQGDLLGYTKVTRDISERKEAEDATERHLRQLAHWEENRKRDEAELRASQEQLATILEGINDAVIVQDPAGKMEYLNPAAAALLGFASPHAVLEAMRSPDAQRMRREVVISDEEGNAVPIDQAPGNLALEGVESPPRLLRYRHNAEAPEKWIVSRARPILDGKGRVQFVISITQDVTDVRKAEAELRQSQKMEAIGRLAGGIAHDFNNLLTAINGYGELGLARAAPADPLYPILKEIVEAGKRAALLTNQLLAHSRKQFLVPKVLDLNGTIRGMHTLLKRIIGEDIDLVTTLNRDGNLVRADPGQVEQVIMNLVINSRDAMPKGGRVTLETQVAEIEAGHVGVDERIPAGRYFLLCVSDTGHGMSKAIRDHIFEPFYTTKPVSKGTGLGLSTVYGIVKQSGGYISVYSEPKLGAAFKIYFPLVGEGSPRQTTSPAGETAVKALHGETILLVEDEGVVRRLSKTILSALEYHVLEAESGEQALELAKSHPGEIDLLLTDVVMSGMRGQELALRIRKLRPETKVVFMSGYTDDAIVRHGVLQATAHFIQKPFSPRALAQKIREVLAQAHPVESGAEVGIS